MAEDDLATRNRMVLKQPVTFEELYHPYANSWRVVPPESMLSSPCGERGFERGVPERPFYANDLNREEYDRAHATCAEAGVRDESLLDACILDVTVLGTRDAARVFARAHPPRAEIRVSSARRWPRSRPQWRAGAGGPVADIAELDPLRPVQKDDGQVIRSVL